MHGNMNLKKLVLHLRWSWEA